MRIQSFIFGVWMQVLDASAEANIQHATTKITNITDWILRLRLFSSTNYNSMLDEFDEEDKRNTNSIPSLKTALQKNMSVGLLKSYEKRNTKKFIEFCDFVLQNFDYENCAFVSAKFLLYWAKWSV